MLHVDDTLDNLFIDVMDWHSNVFDAFRKCARGENINVGLTVLVDHDGLASIRHIQKPRHFEELDRSLHPSK